MNAAGAGLLVAALAAGAGFAPHALACPGADEGFRRLSSPDAEIAYRWDPGDLKVGRFFGAEVVACRAPGGESVREIALDATMPAHGHGMNYRPTAERTAPDRFRFKGLMLHMPGKWRVTFDLYQGDKRTRLAQEVTLAP